MRPEIVVFLLALAVFLFLKFGKGSLSGFSLPKVNALGAAGKWWAKKEIEAKRWSLYTAIAVVSITVSYAIGGNDGYAAAAIIALIGLHIVWLAFSEKSSLFTKTFITGFLLFYIGAWILPDIVKIRDSSWSMTKKAVAEVAVKAKSADESYGKEPKETEAPQQYQRAPVPAYQPQTRVIEIETVEDRYKPAVIPPGVRFNIECPSGGIARYYHRGAPEGVEYPCPLPPNLGDRLRDFHIGFSKDTEDPVIVRVMITPLR